jgi:hypothetical protein
MNSQIHTSLLTGFVEDHIRTAAEARLLPEYQRQPRKPVGRRFRRSVHG